MEVPPCLCIAPPPLCSTRKHRISHGAAQVQVPGARVPGHIPLPCPGSRRSPLCRGQAHATNGCPLAEKAGLPGTRPWRMLPGEHGVFGRSFFTECAAPFVHVGVNPEHPDTPVGGERGDSHRDVPWAARGAPRGARFRPDPCFTKGFPTFSVDSRAPGTVFARNAKELSPYRRF